MRLNKKDGLNIVPFIDIMLVLLAIVLSISTFIAQGKIAVDLPSAKSAQQDKEDEKKVSVVIDKDNKFFIDDAEISEDELKDKLNAVDIKTLIELKSDKNAKFDSFVKVIDILKEKGHENFAIQTISE
ncbi:TonB system transport protein ExbD [Campylobacter concisus]|jgi:tonB system transport protein exbD|uniref:Biopolymer transport protein ExbD n=2 Tax=Campylobacter concisus TaxID=199 RepID=A0A1Y5N9Y9_9BACT|nr:TonB system transport protein ExbD [Campylobacter concisus]EIF07335.1 Biopolymer transport protein ExbD/TolR [Campylobacter concisus UNSWCD]ERJ22822.1 Biopolymer transport protein ExbD [Campylobacter concisus UNSW1]ERJ23982.1 Biopolymer transport protein ExbD [Campylobacter concisus UNSW3]MBE9863318.1 TonB system transport protein ExbD [Campylobacter concisus]MBF0898198.1 TonB system transport protein ExbD [Campylobacter concisus]